MLTVLEHHAEPLAASNTTFKIDTRDEQLEKAALRDPLQIPPNALARGSICPGSERPVRHCFPHHRFLCHLTNPEITESLNAKNRWPRDWVFTSIAENS